MDSKMNVWALFTNGTASRVVISKWDTDNSSGLELMDVGVENIAAKTSAKKAITSAYSVLRSLNRIKGGGHCFAYEFGNNAQVVEASASLAFALELVHLMEDIPFSIAATGIVPDSTSGAMVERVKGVNEKIVAAVEKLSPGEIVFFPEENLKDLASRTELTAHAKGVILQPVKTVEEAINKLLAAASIIEEPANSATAPAIEPPVRKKTPWRPLLFSLCIIAAALAAYHLFKSENTPPPSPGAIESSKLVSPPPPNPTARERAKPAAPARTGPMESEPKEHAAGPGAETNQVSTPPREPGPNAAASSTPVSPERSERGALERPEPASPSAQIPISTEPIKTAHKITPDAKISPNHIKKPAPEKPPARSNRPLHVKIALKGSDDLALAAVSEAIASELEDLGYIIDDQDYDGVISAAVSLTEGEEIPLRPHAGDSEILIQRDLIIKKLAYKSKQGRRRKFDTLTVPVDVTKDQADRWPELMESEIFDGKNKRDFSKIRGK